MPVGRADGTPGCPLFCGTIFFAPLRYYYIMTEEERERLLDALERWEEKYCQSGETERVDEPTPSGGDYSVAYYYDKDHRPCKKSRSLCPSPERSEPEDCCKMKSEE